MWARAEEKSQQAENVLKQVKTVQNTIELQGYRVYKILAATPRRACGRLVTLRPSADKIKILKIRY